jgi:hypothetical protein
MALRIEVDVFSGRPNPVITLDDAAAVDVLERLRPADRLGRAESAPPPESILGYRGLVVEQVGDLAQGLPERFRVVDGKLFGPRLAHRPADVQVEDFVCGATGPIRLAGLDEETLAIIRRLIEERRLIDFGSWPGEVKWPVRETCKCAPLYEPAWWNDGGQRQLNNNCYNYGTNYRTDTFAQPGRGSGMMYPYPIACSGVRPAAIRDDLIDSPKAENKCPPEGHLVALVVGPGWDYHWYRRGRNGLWTHKPGGTPVTNRDNNGVAISDPRTAARGGYTDFCTFMTVMHGHTKIR